MTDFDTAPVGQGSWLETPYTFDDTFPVGEYAAVPGMTALTFTGSNPTSNPLALAAVVSRMRGHNGHDPFAEIWFGFQVTGVYPTTVIYSLTPYPVTPAIPDYLAPVSDFDSACVVGGADGGAHPWTDETVEATTVGVAITGPMVEYTPEGQSGISQLYPISWTIQPVAKISSFDADHPPVLTYALLAVPGDT